MKKTLLICTHYPLPENIGTSMRTMTFVRFFREYGPVDIGYSQVLDKEQIGNPIFSNEYRLETKKFNNIKTRLINGIIKGFPVPIYQFSDNSQKLLLTTVKSNDYDYILVRYLYNTSIYFELPVKYRMRTIIDYDDVLSGSLYKSIFSSPSGPLKRIIFNILMILNKRFLDRYEQKCLRSGASLFCSEKDRERLIGRNQKSGTFVVPNIYSNESFEDYNFGDGFKKGNSLLFVGTLSYGPNIDGLQWFIESVFPDFKKMYPNAKLSVVGHSPGNRARNLCESIGGVELYGDVPDVKEYYKQCRAVVVPLLAGSGTRIKILEAAMANTPVLATPIGAEGLELVDETDILLFRDASEFCSKYTNLLKRDKYDELVNNAKNVVKSYYSKKRFNDVMGQVLEKIDQKKGY